MKRFLLVILLLTVLFFVKAQEINKLDTSRINKANNFTRLSIVETYSLHYKCFDYDIESDRVVKFFQIDKYNSKSLKIEIYNLDFSKYKTIEISCPEGYVPSNWGFVTTNMFNFDDKVEFIAQFKKTTETGTKYINKLYNEDGNVLFDFYDVFPFSACKTVDDNYILNGYDEFYKDVYFTLKPNPTKVSSVNIKRNASPYPNPAAQTINLPYQLNPGEQTDMQIYDVNGKLIVTKRIDATFDKIVLNVSGYEKGMYVYKYNGKSAKFVVE